MSAVTEALPSPEPSAEHPDARSIDGVVPPAEASDLDVRRHPSTIGGAFYLVVLVAVGVSLGIAWTGEWRDGVRWFGGALVCAAAVRLVLPHKDAGMLAVRHRLVDVVMLAGVGVALVFLAGDIPNQPGLVP